MKQKVIKTKGSEIVVVDCGGELFKVGQQPREDNPRKITKFFKSNNDIWASFDSGEQIMINQL